ncbi:MAG: efflux RND transporter permease subunit [Pseudomonadota bacterium]
MTEIARQAAAAATEGGGIAGLSVRRPYLATVASLLIVIAGIAAWFGIEVRELPKNEYPVVLVRGNYPGASPTTVDARVTAVLERAIARISGLSSIRASSEEGSFRLNAVFLPDSDLNDVANDVREAVNGIVHRLPDDLDDLRVFKADRDARSIITVTLTARGGEPVSSLARAIEDEIVPALSSIDGVAEVRSWGLRNRVLRVAVQPERLSAYGLSVGEVATALRAAEFDVPVGSFEADQLSVLVRADASVVEPGRIERLMIRDPVRIGDVASVFFSLPKPENVSRLDGLESVSLGIVRQPQSNTVAISDEVRQTVERLRLSYPTIGFDITDDGAVFIRGAVAEVLAALLTALGIVVLVIWLFLGRLGATLVPSVTIPVALIGSLGALWLLGFSINLITLLALVLAAGIVVDDAIVVTENIQRCRDKGLGPRAAAVIGTRQVFFAVIATTATLIAVFLPISFAPSGAGRVFTEFGAVLSVTVILSSFVALTLCPMIAARLPSLGRPGGVAPAVGRGLGALYGALILPSVRLPLVVLTLAGIGAVGAVGVHQHLGEEITPPEDRGRIQVRLQGPDGTGLDYTDRQVARIEAAFAPYVDSGVVTALTSVTGRWDPNRGQIRAILVPWEERTVTQQQIEADLGAALDALPGARARFAGGNSLGLRGGSGGGGLRMAVVGADYPAIAEAAFALAERLAEIPGLSAGRVQYQATQPQLSIQIDRARAADLDVTMDELSATLRALIDEDRLTEFTVGDEAVRVLLQSAAGAVRDPADLLNLSVRAESGALIPLTQLVTLEEQGVAAELDRHRQRRAVEVFTSLSPEITLAEAVTAVRALAQETLPPEQGLIFLDDAAALEENAQQLRIVFAIAVIVVFLVLVAQFESVTSALVVMVTVPFGLAAAVYALWLTGTTINIYSQIGALMLIGIMAKNGILLVEFADQLRDEGRAVWEAAYEAARVRLRPIAMTLASTVLAGLPLILSEGPGAEGREAIGWVVFGGLGMGALVTLFVTPAAYALIAGWSKPRASAGALLERELAEAR